MAECVYASRVFEHDLDTHTHGSISFPMKVKRIFTYMQPIDSNSTHTRRHKRNTIFARYGSMDFITKTWKFKIPHPYTHKVVSIWAFALLWSEMVHTFWWKEMMLMHKKIWPFCDRVYLKPTVDRIQRSKRVTYKYEKIQSHWKCMANIYNGRRNYICSYLGNRRNLHHHFHTKMAKASSILFRCDTI